MGGLFVILGCTYVWLGLTWIITPTPTRMAGIEWAGLAGHYVGAWWILGGLVALAGGLLAARARWAGWGAFAAIVTPLVVACLFAWSVAEGNSRGWITAGSYAPYALIAAWATARTARTLRESAQSTTPAGHDDEEGATGDDPQ